MCGRSAWTPWTTPEVDADLPFPFFFGNQFHLAAPTDPRIVANDVNLAERGEGLLGGALHRSNVGNVAGNALHLPGALELGDGFSQRLFLDVSQHHLHARLGESAAEGKSDAAWAAGDERRFALELPHRLTSSCFTTSTHRRRQVPFPAAAVRPTTTIHPPSAGCEAGRRRGSSGGSFSSSSRPLATCRLASTLFDPAVPRWAAAR